MLSHLIRQLGKHNQLIMGQFSLDNLEPLIQKRLFHFLNRARTARVIATLDLIETEPDDRADYGIGETVAQRILDRRNELPRRRFTETTQLNGIKGLGEDKMEDLINTMAQSSAEAFRREMYKGVLLSNFDLKYYQIKLVDETFYESVSFQEKLRTILVDRFDDFFQIRISETDKQQALQELQEAYIDAYPRFTSAGSYAFALWFYHFDADNWFSFEQVRLPISRYLDGYLTGDHLELYLFKGFDTSLIMNEGVTVLDLPVVVNRDEKTLTIWNGQLFD